MSSSSLQKLRNEITRYQTRNLIDDWNNSNRLVLHELTEDDMINVEGEINLYKIANGWKAISETSGTLAVRFGVCVSFLAVQMRLTSMVGCPKIVCNSFNVSQNNITSLEGLPLSARVVDLRMNPIKSFEGIENLRGCEEMWLPNSIESNLLGLLKIKTLKKLYCATDFADNRFHLAFHIIKKYLESDKDIIACQRQLIENDLDEYAEL